MKYESARVVFGKMPPLRHTMPEGFDYDTSEVVRWLLSQRVVKQHMFEVAKSSKAIVYDQAAGTWHGRDWKGEG